MEGYVPVFNATLRSFPRRARDASRSRCSGRQKGCHPEAGFLAEGSRPSCHSEGEARRISVLRDKGSTLRSFGRGAALRMTTGRDGGLCSRLRRNPEFLPSPCSGCFAIALLRMTRAVCRPEAGFLAEGPRPSCHSEGEARRISVLRDKGSTLRSFGRGAALRMTTGRDGGLCSRLQRNPEVLPSPCSGCFAIASLRMTERVSS
jgi:hypothetical protein